MPLIAVILGTLVAIVAYGLFAHKLTTSSTINTNTGTGGATVLNDTSGPVVWTQYTGRYDDPNNPPNTGYNGANGFVTDTYIWRDDLNIWVLSGAVPLDDTSGRMYCTKIAGIWTCTGSMSGEQIAEARFVKPFQSSVAGIQRGGL